MRRFRIYLLLVLAGTGTCYSYAQDLLAVNLENKYQWEFTSVVPLNFDDNTVQLAEKDEFGQRIACLKTLMDKYYIFKEEIVVGDPAMRTIIRKPGIYNTARRIEKYLKKEVKKGNIELEKAVGELSYILEVAIAAVEEKNTESFEASLNGKKDSAAEQIGIFRSVKLNNIY